MVACSQAGFFSGRVVALGVTDRRLLVVGLDRRGRPSDDSPTALRPQDIADASAGDAGGGWMNVAPDIMGSAAAELKLRTVDGEKLKLTMMRGTGAFGRLGGGESQRRGIEALSAWFERHAPTG